MTDYPRQLDPRYAAYEILRRVDEGGFSDLLLDSYLERHPQLDPRDRRLLTELVYGVLRLRGRLDFALGGFCRQPLHRLEPGALRLLRLGAYQLLELDRVPAHAAVNASVELARQLGLERVSGLVNGVLRSLERGRHEIVWPAPEEPKAYLQHVCSLPTWLAKELLRQFPNAESRAFGEALATAAPLTLRTNTLKVSREQLLEALSEAGLDARPGSFAPEAVLLERRGDEMLPGQGEGWFQFQDQASMLIAHLLGVESGEKVLDACAAPGGKTTHLAALMENRGSIQALDKYPQRVAMIDQGAQRLGCTIIETRDWDLTEPPAFLEQQSFDRVLLDAPCSGLGVLRRNPESRWQKSAAAVRELAQLQGQLLDQVAPLVRPDGVLLYSVCTFTRAETDAVIDAFLARNKGFTLENLHGIFPQSWEALLDERGCLRSYPHRHEGMDAFFAARLRRNAEGDDVPSR